MFVFKKLQMPVGAAKQIEILAAENANLKQQVEEQSDALVELAEIIAGGNEDG